MNPKIQPNPDSLKAGAHGLVKRLAGAGFQAYWVGGCVRDDRLGQTPTDYDIATDATPDEIEQLFRKTIPVGKQYGVIMVLEAGHEYQVATFRAEGDYTDGRRPGSVRFTDAREDALRRDFTINGMFMDPQTGEVFDDVGGRHDLQQQLVRAIGDPELRIDEDKLRMLRAIRFTARWRRISTGSRFRRPATSSSRGASSRPAIPSRCCTADGGS